MCLFIKDGKWVENAGRDILCYKKTRPVDGDRNKWRGVYVGVRKYAYNRILTAERRIVEDGGWAYTEVEHLKPETQWSMPPRINEGFHAKTRVAFPTGRGYHYCVIPKGTEMCYGKDDEIVAVRMIVFRCIWNYIGYKLKKKRKEMIRLLWKRLFNLPVYRYDLLKYILHHNHALGICGAVYGALVIAGLREVYYRETDDVDDSGISIQYPHILPKLTYTNAQQFNGNFYYKAYWFPLGDWKKRKEFIRWMMNEYKNDKTDLRTISM